MKRRESKPFRRQIESERAVIMLPLNVVMAARISGPLDHANLAAALERLRVRHPLLAVRVDLKDDGTAFFTDEGVPAIPVHVEARERERQWIARVERDIRTPFVMETGPLFRCAVIQSPEGSELVVCGHHAVCDGKSLAFLLRDILEQLDTPSDVEPLLPPAIRFDTVATPPGVSRISRAIIKWINRAWRREKRCFDFGLMAEMHQRYWQRNSHVRLLVWQLSESETTSLVKRCRSEGVTVNSALWAAFMAVQHEVQGSAECFRNRAGLAISTRDKLNVPVGEALGFYASSHKVVLKGYQGQSFWDAARIVHAQLKRSIDKANPFQMLAATLLDPTLLDSLYFSKYGFAPNRLSGRLLKKMKWDRVSHGTVITNVGRMDIPTVYGDLRLEAVYGPLIYSDVNEKNVGVVTMGNQLSFAMGHHSGVVDARIAETIRDRVVKLIREAAAPQARSESIKAGGSA